MAFIDRASQILIVIFYIEKKLEISSILDTVK